MHSLFKARRLFKFKKNGRRENSSATEKRQDAGGKSSGKSGARKNIIEKLKLMMDSDTRRVPPLWRDYLYINHVFWGTVDTSLAKTPASAEAAGERELLLLFLHDQMKTLNIIDTYQHQGHFGACLDPLSVMRRATIPPDELLPGKEGTLYKRILLNRKKKVNIPDNTFISGYGDDLTVDETIRRLNKSYSKSIGYEYMHISSQSVCQWMRKTLESPDVCPSDLPAEEKKKLMRGLIKAECLDQFLKEKYSAHDYERHSLAGFVVMVPALKYLIDAASDYGAESFVIGMNSPRGRINLLSQVMRKPMMKLFEPFETVPEECRHQLGAFVKRVARTGHSIEFALVPSTADYGSCDSSVLGKARAEQHYRKDNLGLKVWPVMIHNENVLKCQGLTYQAIRLSTRPRFLVRGTVHIVLSNQSELPLNSMSRVALSYCTNVAYTVAAPVMHVNAYDPESVFFVIAMAAQYRAKFQSDVFVNIVGFAKPEQDDKQLPDSYMKKIDEVPSIGQTYAKQLIKDGVVTQTEVDVMRLNYMENVANEFDRAQLLEFNKGHWLTTRWKKFFKTGMPKMMPETGLNEVRLKAVIEKFIKYSPSDPVKPDWEAHWTHRLQLASQNKINWYMAEAIAFATLLEEGYHVRLSGQDCDVNDYNERNYVLYSSENNKTEVPLQQVYGGLENKFVVGGTYHSEAAAVTFLGAYSQASPRCLVVWEGTPYDNFPEVLSVCDKFLAYGEAKWIRQCGLILLLAHGLNVKEYFCDSQPAAILHLCPLETDYWKFQPMIERLRQSNWIVTYVTTPANYFHLLRRHACVNFRKPLVNFTHKKVFHDLGLVSEPVDLGENKTFMNYIPDHGITDHKSVERVLFCCGEVYFDLLKERNARGLGPRIALCRIEQLYPFPFDELRQDVLKYEKAQLFWVQYESKNMGWWDFAQSCLAFALKGNALLMAKPIEKKLGYIGPAKNPPSFYQSNDTERYSKVINKALDLSASTKPA